MFSVIIRTRGGTITLESNVVYWQHCSVSNSFRLTLSHNYLILRCVYLCQPSSPTLCRHVVQCILTYVNCMLISTMTGTVDAHILPLTQRSTNLYDWKQITVKLYCVYCLFNFHKK